MAREVARDIDVPFRHAAIYGLRLGPVRPDVLGMLAAHARRVNARCLCLHFDVDLRLCPGPRGAKVVRLDQTFWHEMRESDEGTWRDPCSAVGRGARCTVHNFNAEAAVLPTLSIITVKSIAAVLRTPYRASLHNWRHWLLISPLSWMFLAPAVERTNCFGVGRWPWVMNACQLARITLGRHACPLLAVLLPISDQRSSCPPLWNSMRKELLRGLKFLDGSNAQLETRNFCLSAGKAHLESTLARASHALSRRHRDRRVSSCEPCKSCKGRPTPPPSFLACARTTARLPMLDHHRPSLSPVSTPNHGEIGVMQCNTIAHCPQSQPNHPPNGQNSSSIQLRSTRRTLKGAVL